MISQRACHVFYILFSLIYVKAFNAKCIYMSGMRGDNSGGTNSYDTNELLL